MIELRNVTKVFRDPKGEDIVAVDHLNLRIEDAETICFIGRSGCGKTTTLKLINRLEEPTSGSIQIDGEDIHQRDLIALRRSMGYVIQTGGLFPHMTVARNVGLLCGLQSWDPNQINQRVNALLELVNLAPKAFASRYPRELSGGQRQRVGVARALALDPPYLLMDEPFGALDPITRYQIHQEFHNLKQRIQKTIILVTHDLEEAFNLGDRIAFMDRGALVQVGDQEDFTQRPANDLVRRFLKEFFRKNGKYDG